MAAFLVSAHEYMFLQMVSGLKIVQMSGKKRFSLKLKCGGAVSFVLSLSLPFSQSPFCQDHEISLDELEHSLCHGCY